MDEHKAAKIKNAVRKHFEESPDHYDEFEGRYGFFKNLNESLLAKMYLPDEPAILDVGCGTGISSLQIVEALPSSRVWGLDISAAMLEKARSTIGESERLRFVEGDAAKLSDLFDVQFDGIIYSASVFLIPDFRESLRQARDLLKPGGSVGLTFMDGVYDTRGRNMFAVADAEAGAGVSLKRAVKLMEFHDSFKKIFPLERAWNKDFRPGEQMLRDFFSIPAMSAGLFPGLEYPERVKRVNLVIDHFPKIPFYFRWMFMIGEVKQG